VPGFSKEKTWEAGEQNAQKLSASNIQNWWTRWGVYFLVPALVLLLRLPILHNQIIFIDEPIYLAQAQRIARLDAFIYSFQYLAETKFQFSLVPYIAALQINYDYALLVSRLLAVVALTVSGWLILQICREFLGTYFPALFTALVWGLFLTMNKQTAAPLLEQFQIFWLLLSFYALLKTFRSSRSLIWLGGSGLALAIAGLIKVNAWALGPLFVLIILTYPQTSENRQARLIDSLKKAAVLTGAVLLPIAAVLLPYFLRADGLALLERNLLGSLFSYSTFDRAQPLSTRLVLLVRLVGDANLVAIFLGTTGLLLGSIVARRQKQMFDPARRNGWLALLVGVGMLASFIPGQSKDHYLISVIPFLTLGSGYGLFLLGRYIPGKIGKPVFVSALAVWLLIGNTGSLQYYAESYADRGKEYKAAIVHLDKTRLAEYIQQNSRPDDSLWVYYNYPELYLAARRVSAVNEPTGTYLVDFYNEIWFKRILAELEQSRPGVIVGVNRPHYYFTRPWAAAVIDLPFISDYIRQNYVCDTGLIPEAVVCKRK
jgi:hypothetical protein